jgi:hypothetical protein
VRHGPARPGEKLIHHRFWMGSDTYQTVGSAWNLMAATSCLEWLTARRPSCAACSTACGP